MAQQDLFSGGPKRKSKRKTKPRTTAATLIDVRGYQRKRGKLPARAKNGRFKRGKR